MPLVTNISTAEIRTRSVEDILTSFSTDAEGGLGSDTAQQRLQQSGLNSIDTKKKRSEIVAYLLHFKSPLVIILLVASVVSYSLGEPVNASIFFA